MTGFGSATLEVDGAQITAEVKTLNSKFLEVFLKLPREFNDKENELRTLITQQLERGKVNVSVEVKYGTALPTRTINKDLFKSWYMQLQETADSVGAKSSDLFKLALNMPEVIAAPESTDVQAVQVSLAPEVVQAVVQALDKCNQFRTDEGTVLAAKLSEYIEDIRSRLLAVEEHDPTRLANTRQRLYDRLQELGEKVQIDHNRFEQELIYYLEKLDVSEEKVRLRAHLDYFLEAIAEGSGKKLGFIAQEIGREINTIGSKINEAQIQRLVVEMKDVLERIKEQSLNVL